MKRSKSILLIADNKNDRFFFIRALREIKNTIFYDVAHRGNEALDKLENSITCDSKTLRDQLGMQTERIKIKIFLVKCMVEAGIIAVILFMI